MGRTAYPPELKEQARELRKAFGPSEIAKKLGVSPNTVMRWCDPERAERDRVASARYKRSLKGTCKTCGKETGYIGLAGKPVSDECHACHIARQHEERYWTQERIVEAVQRFAAEHGRPPVSTDWLYGKHGLQGDGYPYATTVINECGSWANAIEAAGFERPRVGGYERTREWRLANAERHRKPLEEYLERIRAASVDGLAPSSYDPRINATYTSLWRRGIKWQQACEMAGVRSRRPR